MRATTIGAIAALTLIVACQPEKATYAPPAAPLITAVKIEAATTFFAPGDYVQLEARALDVFGNPIPDVRFSWTSSNRNVATVDDGLVHFLAAGNVSVIAVAERVPGHLAMTVRVIPPVIQELEPAVLSAGQPATVTVWGTGFYRGSVVRLNGRGKPTTFVTGRLLRVELSSADVAELGEHTITVYNAVPGAGLSNSLPIEIR